MANKQPFYHRAEILFTATKDIVATEEDRKRLQRVIDNALRNEYGILYVKNSVSFDGEPDADPGDPGDLVR